VKILPKHHLQIRFESLLLVPPLLLQSVDHMLSVAAFESRVLFSIFNRLGARKAMLKCSSMRPSYAWSRSRFVLRVDRKVLNVRERKFY
jgi:hypothetical protein